MLCSNKVVKFAVFLIFLQIPDGAAVFEVIEFRIFGKHDVAIWRAWDYKFFICPKPGYQLLVFMCLVIFIGEAFFKVTVARSFRRPGVLLVFVQRYVAFRPGGEIVRDLS